MDNITILIAEDDPPYLSILSEFLEDSGYKVLQATNANEIIVQAEGAMVWILDVMLGEEKVAGIQAVKRLSDEGIYKQQSVVFISNFGANGMIVDHELRQLREKGVLYCWLDKPVDLLKLKKIIASSLEEK